jgi:hypothetical protein
MKGYRFQVQKCIDIEVIGISAEQARTDLIDNLASYADDMIRDCYVSDGEEIKKDA